MPNKGICKKANSIGVPTHVSVEPDQGGRILMTVEDYTDQDIRPFLQDLPVCPEMPKGPQRG